MRGRLQQIGLIAAAVALGALAAPVQAQFGGIRLGGSSSSRSSDGCAEGKSRSAGSRIAGGILGSVAGSVAGRASSVLNYVPVAELTDQLTATIACKLDPMEQKQAADATLNATRGDEMGMVNVGDMSAWTSETRDEVSGTSTVTAKNDPDGRGRECITVSDVIIVSGEETRADKRMCRVPPAVRYAIAA